jgi:hypothetical protein
MHAITGKNKILLGIDKDTREKIYLSKPTFDCGHYWGFGYLGNKNCHYHLNAYQQKTHFLELADGTYKHLIEKRNVHIKDCLEADYDLNPTIQANIWVFCELALSIYTLKAAAEVLTRGGAHTTTNPCKDIIKDEKQAAHLNGVVLPEVIQTLWDLIT